MKVHVDASACVASGMCAASASEIFRLDDALGVAIVLTEDVPSHLEAAVEDAEACCPVSAITIVKDVTRG